MLSFEPTSETFAYVGDDVPVERDLVAELTELMADRDYWTVNVLRKPKEQGGVGAAHEAIKEESRSTGLCRERKALARPLALSVVQGTKRSGPKGPLQCLSGVPVLGAATRRELAGYYPLAAGA